MEPAEVRRAKRIARDGSHCAQHFKPEFLNRVDDIIIFNPLGKEQLTKIVELRLEDLRRLLADRKISLELTPAAKECSSAKATIRTTARVRSSAPSSGWCKTRWR